jgi:hypothetical protein
VSTSQIENMTTAELRRRRAYWLTALCRLASWEREQAGPLDGLAAIEVELRRRRLHLEGAGRITSVGRVSLRDLGRASRVHE